MDSVTFSLDGQRIASGLWDEDVGGTVKIWDARTGAEVSSVVGVRCM